MSESIQKLIDQRLTLVQQAQTFLEECEADHGGLTPDEDAQFAEMHADVERLGNEINEANDARERLASRRNAVDLALEQADKFTAPHSLQRANVRDSVVAGFDQGRPEQLRAEQCRNFDLALQGWLVGSLNPLMLTDDHRAAVQKPGIRLGATNIDMLLPKIDNRQNRMAIWHREGGNEAEIEQRIARQILMAQSVGTNSEGGFLVPEGFVPSLERAMLAYGGLRRVVTVRRTASGNDLPFPKTNDTGNTGALISENVQDSEQDVTFAATTLGAYTYTSKIVRVSVELMQDSAFSMGAELGSMLGERLGRIQNTHGTTGTGSSQPNGIVTAATVGKTAASATAITFDELYDLKHSVDPAYRSLGANWMFSDNTLLAIKKLKDGDSRYLWQAGTAGGAPDTIDGDRFVVNQDVADIASTAKSVVYGACQKYVLREVRDITIVRLVERYADFRQVAFVGFMRFDGDLIDAGTNPVKVLQQAT